MGEGKQFQADSDPSSLALLVANAFLFGFWASTRLVCQTNFLCALSFAWVRVCECVCVLVLCAKHCRGKPITNWTLFTLCPRVETRMLRCWWRCATHCGRRHRIMQLWYVSRRVWLELADQTSCSLLKCLLPNRVDAQVGSLARDYESEESVMRQLLCSALMKH